MVAVGLHFIRSKKMNPIYIMRNRNQWILHFHFKELFLVGQAALAMIVLEAPLVGVVMALIRVVRGGIIKIIKITSLIRTVEALSRTILRNFSCGDVHLQQQQSRPVLRNFKRPPPNRSPFITSPGPYISSLGIPEMPSPVYYVHTSTPEPLGGITFMLPSRPPPSCTPTFLFPVVDPGLQIRLVKQIEYYFSADNLCKDVFLRQNMDEEGWVPISLIASFNRVKQIVTNILVILDALQISTEVEVQETGFLCTSVMQHGYWCIICSFLDQSVCVAYLSTSNLCSGSTK